MTRALALAALVLGACAMTPDRGADPHAAVVAAIDAFHRAAAAADGEAYFDRIAADGVVLGTDAGERWSKDEFRAFAEPYFAEGTGWTYEPLERHVRVEGDVAWFDERLTNEKYGEVRGSGVLVRAGDAWRMAQFIYSFPVPNELAADLVERVRALEGDGGAR